MPDLNQLLDTLVADVTAGTRAPGAQAAIKQARRRRAKVAVAAAGAVAFIAVGGALTAGTVGGSDRVSPVGEPTTPSSESPTVQESAESPAPSWINNPGLDAILAQAPNWTYNHTTYNHTSGDLREIDPTIKGPCSGDWARGPAVVGGHPSKGEVTSSYWEPFPTGGLATTGFPSEADASDAAARFVANLDSCTTTAWRTQPIAQTGAVLASWADAVVWIQQKGADLIVLQIPTPDGPPPAGIQVEVAEWMVAHSTWDQ